MDVGGLKRKAKSDINVTPLIDVVLVLLIVFIVMVPSLSKALLVTVPKITATPPPPVDPANPPVVISVLRAAANNEYQFQLQATPIQLKDIPGKLTPVLLRQVPGFRKVFLKIDGEVPYQIAVNAMDQIRLASDQAKQETRAKSSVDGGDVKVVVSVKK